jgi:DNA topoisomerase IB
VAEPATLERIRGLVIPPAWQEVWICLDPLGHLQAVGRDARGRRQYRYHPLWRERRDREKFERMTDFARRLPDMRRTCATHLAGPDLIRERVLACALRLLDLGFFRVGGGEYAAANHSFGLATIEKGHVRLEGERALVFEFPAKGGKERIQSVVDEAVYDVVARLRRRRGGGPQLLARRQGRRWVDVRLSDINEFLAEATGGPFTAKDFRTWHATVLAAVALATAEGARSQRARLRAIRRCMEEVSHYLGNTPVVCRNSYVDPRVVDCYLAGATIAPALAALYNAGWALSDDGRAAVEAAVLELLEDEHVGVLRAA